jgi:hypothetical protein
MSTEDVYTKMKKIIACMFPLISFLGTFGNVFSFVFFSRKKFKNTIFRTYFRFLCITDTLALFVCMCTFAYDILGINLRTFNEFSCKLIVLMAYSMPTTSAWTLVAISLDRLVNLVFPFKLLFRKKIKFQVSVCIGILLANNLYYVQTLFSHIITTFEYYEYIDYQMPNASNLNETFICFVYSGNQLLLWLDFFNASVLPFLFMIIFTSISITYVFRSRMSANANSSQNVTRNDQRQRAKDVKYAITSIALNIVFFVLNIPLVVFYLVGRYVPDFESTVYAFIGEVALLLYYTNSASVFYINLTVNSIFQDELLFFWREIKRNF